MKVFCFFVICFFIFFSFVKSNENKKRVLVLVDDLNIKHTHSIFFDHLRDSGFELSINDANDPSLSLSQYGEYLYDSLILFSPRTEDFGGLVDVGVILDFIDDGNNVLIAADSDLSDPMRELASECGVDFDEEGSEVVDHVLHLDSSEGDHNTIISSRVIDAPIILGGKSSEYEKGVLFKGIGHLINGTLNFPILSGEMSSYSSVQDSTEDPFTFGTDTLLVSALQARNNARVVVSGSLDLFSNRFFNQKIGDQHSMNKQFCKELSKWVFGDRGILKATNIMHYREGEFDIGAPAIYRIKDNVTYQVDIKEYKDGKWVPYIDKDALQLEFIMLDPYVRTKLTPDSKGTYKATFMLPDTYGVFTFKVHYEREGYTTIDLITRTPVRPYKHNEYERFIETAFPYYTGCFTMIVTLFLFSVLFIYSK